MAIPKSFTYIGGLFNVLLILLYSTCTTYDYKPKTLSLPDGSGQYSFFQDVHVMIFIGFGFLMAFLKKYSFSTTGISLYIACISVAWGILAEGFWERMLSNEAGEENNNSWKAIEISLDQLVDGDFAAGAVLITFGALVGRVSISQMAIVAFIEVILFTLLLNIEVLRVRVADVGGSMAIHAFGAYFGLTVSYVLEKLNPSRTEKDESLNSATHDSDTKAMIGTLFLWCFWPSFNAYFGSNDGRSNRIVVNTYFSLVGSTLMTFVICAHVYHGKLRMVEVQNATLAGGVAIGSAADMALGPGAALLVGSIAGIVSVLGYRYLSPYLKDKWGLKDTCGIHNLHAMPGLLGGVVAIIGTALADENDENYINFKYEKFGPFTSDPSGSSSSNEGSVITNGIYLVWPGRLGTDLGANGQMWLQIYYLCIVLVFAVGGGAITALLISQIPIMDKMYDDDEEWEMEEEEEHGENHNHHAEKKSMNAERDGKPAFFDYGFEMKKCAGEEMSRNKNETLNA